MDDLEFFDTARSASMAIDVIDEMESSAQSLDRANEPSLAQRVRDLARRLRDEMIDRFGFAEAGRFENDREPIDLDDAQRTIRDEREMFFETDSMKVAEMLDDRGYYGDNRSGGAEGRVSGNEDGTYTASVGYDRDREEETFEDRDEAIAWAADRIADYNSDTIPSSYREDADLAREAEEAKTPEQASAFADKLDSIADDLEGNRGDPAVARKLRESADSIRDAIARREAQNQAQVPDEPTTPETMDEMAVDPDLNPEGYARSVADDIASQISERPDEGSYISADGRVQLEVQADIDGMQFFISVDKDPLSDEGIVFEGLNLNRGDVIDEINKAVTDHFSKKA